MNNKLLKATLIIMVAALAAAMLLLPACVVTKTVTVDFESNGGSNVASLTVEKGKPFDPPTAPRKPGYSFAGWYLDSSLTGIEFDFSGITKDITLYAKWDIGRYTYTFYADDGATVLKTETLDYGAEITPPANPTKPATAQYTYTFTGWGKTVPATLTDNIDFTAAFSQTVNQYTYTFYAEDGVTVLSTDTLDYGSPIIPPENPTKPSTLQYTYTFTGWGKTVPAALTENITFTAAYSQAARRYTYTFFAEDGTTVLETRTLDFGSAITPPENPTKPATAQYTYTFTGWDKAIPATLTENITFTAAFSQTLKTYTYTFFAEDGVTVLKTETLDYGSAIIPPENPAKPATAQYTYTFAGWGITVPAALTENIDFTAAFSQAVNKYTYTFYSDDGVTVLKTETVDYGSQIVPPDTDKAQTELYSYVFDGWDKEIPEELTQNIDFTAYYLQNKRTYQVSFEEEDGEEVTDIEAVWGTDIEAPGDPERPGYQFAGWQDAEGEDYVFTVMPVGGITLYAQWIANINTLGFDGNGGDGFMDAIDISTDETVTLPQNTFDRAGFTFEGWAVSAGGQAEYADDASYTMGPLSAYTLYAVWKANTNELLLDPNGALGAAISLEVGTYQKITLPANAYRRTGYTFLGWAETWEGGAVYADQAEYTMGTEEICVLYAVWEAMPGTEGLMYTFINYGTEYEVSGIGTASGDIVVPAYHEGLPVTKVGYGAFIGCEELTSIIIADGVTVIDGLAFSLCEYLTTAELPETLQEIGMSAFSEAALTSIRLPDSLATIGGNAFYGSHLTSVSIPKLANISGQAFGACLALTEINVDEENNNYLSIDGVLFDKSGAVLLAYPAGKSNLSYTVPADVTTVADYAFYYNSYLRSLTFDGDVTSIGANAFSYCISLNDIDLPESVESIGMEGFSYCSSLTSATLPAGITEISANLFLDCSSLQSVEALGALTSIGYGAFCNCTELTGFIIPTSVGYVAADAFKDCPSLTLYCELPEAPASWDADWNPDPALVYWLSDGVKREYTFETNGGSTIDSIFDYHVISSPETDKSGYIIENWYTNELFSGSPAVFPYFSKTLLTLYAKWMLAGTEGLVFSLVEDAAAYEVSDAGSARSAAKIVIPSHHLGLPVIGLGEDALYGCENLTEIVLPEGLLYIGAYALEDCYNLTGIVIPASVTSIGQWAFAGCSVLEEIVVNEGSAAFRSIDGVVFDITGKVLLIYPCGKGISYSVPEGITDIGAAAFSGSEILSFVEISAGVITIGEEAFAGCYNLANVVFSSGSLLSSIGAYAFGYTAIEAIELPSGVVYIGEGAFGCCWNLISISIPDGVTRIENWTLIQCTALESVLFGVDSLLEEIGEYAFYDCGNLANIQIPAGVTSLGSNAFNHCESLINITIPAGVAHIPSYAFYYCKSLESVTFADGSVLTTIGQNAFGDCDHLKSVVLPSGVESIGEAAFIRCHALESFLSAQDGALEMIGDYAFFECGLLETVVLSENLTSIGAYAFSDCSALSVMTIYALSPPELGLFALVVGHMSFTIYVPAESVDNYKSDWSAYAGIIFSAP